jgi:hypothetical protein
MMARRVKGGAINSVSRRGTWLASGFSHVRFVVHNNSQVVNQDEFSTTEGRRGFYCRGARTRGHDIACRRLLLPISCPHARPWSGGEGSLQRERPRMPAPHGVALLVLVPPVANRADAETLQPRATHSKTVAPDDGAPPRWFIHRPW